MRISKYPSNKMQNVAFHSVEEFLEFLPQDELVIVQYLRNVIYNCIPDVTEKLTYNVPFFRKRKTICFIWPASILWGKKKSYEGVRLGFSNGHLINDEISFLDKGDRKQVSYKDFLEINPGEMDILKAYIYEAALIDNRLNNKQIK
jgi:hypothetical protein